MTLFFSPTGHVCIKIQLRRLFVNLLISYASIRMPTRQNINTPSISSRHKPQGEGTEHKSGDVWQQCVLLRPGYYSNGASDIRYPAPKGNENTWEFFLLRKEEKNIFKLTDFPVEMEEHLRDKVRHLCPKSKPWHTSKFTEGRGLLRTETGLGQWILIAHMVFTVGMHLHQGCSRYTSLTDSGPSSGVLATSLQKKMEVQSLSRGRSAQSFIR